MADFWKEAQLAYEQEVEGEDEEDFPSSPVGHSDILRDIIEELENPIQKGDIQESRRWLATIAGYCCLIADSMIEWQYHNGIWTIELWGDNFVEILSSTGDSVLFEWDFDGINTYDIYRVEEPARRTFQERIRGKKDGSHALSLALKDYIKVEIEEAGALISG